jgi:heat shock protein HtpX
MWFKRIFLFLAVNILVMTTISLILGLFGVQGYLNAGYGIDYRSLAIICLVWGMGGSFISLLLSRFMVKRLMGVEVIDPTTRDPALQGLVQMVFEHSRAAGLTTMPEVGIYDSPDLNAFATGPSRSRALVAVSTGLMSRMDKKEIEGVIGHEVSHIANGDMVTLTLLQGVVNAFVMFLARVLAFFVSQMLRSSNDREERSSSPWLQYFLVQIFQFVLMIFGSMVVAWFSRYREFRADSGSAKIAGRDKMIAALKKLQRAYEMPIHEEAIPAQVQAFQISSRKGGILQLFSSHPPLEDRIQALENQRY